MELAAAGLQEQPFRTHGEAVLTIAYAAQQATLDFLRETYNHPNGLGLLQGPPLSGKTTILTQFAASIEDEAAVAVVDSARLGVSALLERILGRFGYPIEFSTAGEMANMIKVVSMQQAAAGNAPLLVLENAHAMLPDAMKVICDLVKVRVRRCSALRIVLASDRSLEPIVNAPGMQCVVDRLTGECLLWGMTERETTDYIHEKLRAGGCLNPSWVIPEDVAAELHRASGGWPGVVDRLALLALARAESCPIGIEHVEHPTLPDSEWMKARRAAMVELNRSDLRAVDEPLLYLTHNGMTVKEVVLDQPRALVGRSEHNDLSINSRYVSRHHALFIRHGDVTFLMDLNSTNGTYVNSRRVSNHVMSNDDIVTIGSHRIKFVHAAAASRAEMNGQSFDDTVVMKNLGDLRRMLSRENTQTLPLEVIGALGPGEKTG